MDNRYTGRIFEYGITTNPKGDPQITVQFEYTAGTETKTITWYGSLKEGRAREITVDALLTMGLVGNDVTAVAKGATGNALDVMTPVQLTIGDETYEGKTRTKVKWINPVSEFKGMTVTEATVKLGAIDLKGLVAARRQTTGITGRKTTTAAYTNGAATVTQDDLTF